MTKTRVCLLLALLLPAALSAQEVEPLVTDRPDFTESALSVPRGSVQLEAGVTVEDAAGADVQTFGEALLRIGVGRGIELRVGVPSIVRVDIGGLDESGLDDASIGAKLELAAAGGVRPEAALLVSTSLPTGDDLFGEDDLQPGAVLALAWGLGETIGLGANAGYAYPSEGGDRFHESSASVALGVAATERTGFYFEVYGIAASEGRDDQAFVNTGMTFLMQPTFQLDARVGAGLTDASADAFFGVGFSRRW